MMEMELMGMVVVVVVTDSGGGDVVVCGKDGGSGGGNDDGDCHGGDIGSCSDDDQIATKVYQLLAIPLSFVLGYNSF